MRSKRFIHPATLFFLMTVGVVLFSWIATVYQWEEVNSLLGVENLRWLLRYFVHDFFNQPILPYIFFLFFACGLLVHSGLADAFRRLVSRGVKISRKEKRSLWLVGVLFLLYIVFLLFLVFGPYNLLRSVVGTFENSPFSQGLVLLIGFILSVVSIVYGFTTDFYQTDRDVIHGMAYFFSRVGEFFVILFFISMFFMVLARSGFAAILHISEGRMDWLSSVCSLLALAYCLRLRRSS